MAGNQEALSWGFCCFSATVPFVLLLEPQRRAATSLWYADTCGVLVNRWSSVRRGMCVPVRGACVTTASWLAQTRAVMPSIRVRPAVDPVCRPCMMCSTAQRSTAHLMWTWHTLVRPPAQFHCRAHNNSATDATTTSRQRSQHNVSTQPHGWAEPPWLTDANPVSQSVSRSLDRQCCLVCVVAITRAILPQTACLVGKGNNTASTHADMNKTSNATVHGTHLTSFTAASHCRVSHPWSL